MNIIQLRKRLLEASVAVPAIALASAMASTAMAQEAADPAIADEAAEADADEGDVILVTGSRIARPDLESTVPITSISGESFIEQGNSNVGDTLNELPQLRSTRQQQNPSTGIGIAGLNLLDLRGLGTNRTLVLVNGRRHVAGDLTSNAVSPDINTIPNDLIERVDIVTGGNSAIYGSDAIAGVVNFVLRRDYDGLQIRGNAGISTPGTYGANTYVSAMWGTNFADGRGNITLHGEYAHQDRFYASDVPHLRTVEGLGVVDADAAANPSDGNPDSVYFRNITNRNGSRFGTVFISEANAASATAAGPLCGLGVGATPANQVAYNCLFVFDATSALSPSTETTRFSTGPIGGAVGGNLDNGREGRLYSLIPDQDRYNANLLAHYEFSPAFDVFVEGKFAHIVTQGSNSGAAGIAGNYTQFDVRERLRLDNPFLTPAQRTTIANAITASGCNTSSTGTACSATPTTFSGPLTAAQRAAIIAGTYRFALGRSEVTGGVRDERFVRDTYRVVGGVRGTFMDDWNYEVSLNYGRMEEDTTTQGFVDQQRLMLSLDAGLDPATNTIRCRSQFDPTAALAYDRGGFQVGASSRGNADQLARLAADIAACVPYNPFGGTYDNTAAQNYFKVTTRNKGWAEQFVASGFVGGDTSEFFELPGGPVRFALGAEYRKEDLYLKQDDFAGTAGNTNNVVLGPSGLYLDPAAFVVKEAFGEIQIPLLADMPFFEELTLSGAARVAKYQGGTGTVWAYNAGVDWAPVRDIRFRGNYSRAVRAPQLTEVSGSLVNNFAPNFQDPCRPAGLAAGTSFRAANCAADLAGLTVQDRSYSLPVVSGFNPDLSAETSDSWTIGTVIQPRWVPGLSLTVDYYDITVNDIIASPTAQQIANSCYDQPTRDNIFCQNFSRWRGPGNGPLNETPGEILGNSLLQAPLNFAKRTRRGIDTQVSYRVNLWEDVRLSTFLIYTHNLEISNFENPADPTFENRVLSELGDPEDEFRWDTDLNFGAFTLGHRLRYIGPMVVGVWENYNPLNGQNPQNADAADILEYPEVFYNDIRFEWDVDGEDVGYGEDFNFYLGVDNIFNTKPPLGATGAGAGGGGGGADRPGSAASTGAIYDIRGRQLYAGFRARF
jgi:outer membrane receptor protein involved in Fe transport